MELLWNNLTFSVDLFLPCPEATVVSLVQTRQCSDHQFPIGFIHAAKKSLLSYRLEREMRICRLLEPVFLYIVDVSLSGTALPPRAWQQAGAVESCRWRLRVSEKYHVISCRNRIGRNWKFPERVGRLTELSTLFDKTSRKRFEK